MGMLLADSKEKKKVMGSSKCPGVLIFLPSSPALVAVDIRFHHPISLRLDNRTYIRGGQPNDFYQGNESSGSCHVVLNQAWTTAMSSAWPFAKTN
jgi:hypothetical protein